MTKYHAIFFDLGKTLLYPKTAWQTVYLNAQKALTQSLIEQGVAVDKNTFPYEFAERLNRYYVDRETTLRELGTAQLLEELLTEKGFGDAPHAKQSRALNAFYAITQKNWLLEDDAYRVLDALKLMGLELALISNAADDADVQALIDKYRLHHYFEFIRSSAKAGYRKPHAYIFREALSAMKLFPEQCIMVGDTLDADILGANKLDIYSIWINRRVNKGTRTLQDIHPKAIIEELSELPKLILELSH